VWHFWQYSGDGNMLGSTYGAQSSSIDLDRFNGNMDAFEAFINGEVPEEPPHEIFLPYIARVNAERGLFTHSEPNVLVNTRVGALFNNTEVEVVQEDGAWRKCKAEYWSHGSYLIEK